jgi:aconitase B
MASLYELTKQQLELKTKLQSINFDEETINDTLEGNSSELQEKIENYGFVIRDRLSFVEAMDAEIKRMTERRDAELKRIDHTKEWLLSSMIVLEIDKIECPIFTISVQNNPPSVEIYNDKLIPDCFMKIPEPKPIIPAPDKVKMLKHMKEGWDIDGCKMIQKKRLVIK